MRLVMLSADPSARLARARESLEGLSVGDAFGECYFGRNDIVGEYLRNRQLLDAPWYWTDDTNMALSIYENLARFGEVRQGDLAKSFARYYDRRRGYGAGAHQLLVDLFRGTPWQEASTKLFNGSGSYGNGAAMRVAPVGAYFADDMDAVIEHARRSAEVTHAHSEGIAGAIAVAVAAATACHLRGSSAPTRQQFIDAIFPYIPQSEVRSFIRRARDLTSREVKHAADILGTGSQISAQDTVPFVLWCAGEYLSNFEDAMWITVSGLGDRDTTCAMVGGIIACYLGVESIPAEWIRRREPLPEWALGAINA